jgi:hypothetical protein
MENITTQNTPASVPDQIDPVGVVIGLLISGGHPRPEEWLDFLNPIERRDVYDQTKPHLVRRFLVNRALRLTLGSCPGDVGRERYCLIDTGAEDVWLKLFNEEILPVMLEKQLPVQWQPVNSTLI